MSIVIVIDLLFLDGLAVLAVIAATGSILAWTWIIIITDILLRSHSCALSAYTSHWSRTVKPVSSRIACRRGRVERHAGRVDDLVVAI